MQSTKLINDKDFLCFWLFHRFSYRTGDLCQKKNTEKMGEGGLHAAKGCLLELCPEQQGHSFCTFGAHTIK